MKKLILAIAMVAMFAATGCLDRSVIRVEDNSARPLTTMETLDRYHIFGYAVGVHYRFWTCTDQSTELTCKVECDGETDLDCIGGGWGK